MSDCHPTLLAALAGRDTRSYAEIVSAWNALAAQMQEPGTLSLRQFHRWMSGGVIPRGSSQRVSERFWQRPVAELLRPTPTVQHIESPSVALDIRKIVMAAAEDAADHSSNIANYIDPEAIEALAERVGIYARQYAATPPLELFYNLRKLRDSADRLLEHTHAPGQQEPLYLILSQTSALLAGVSFDLGVSDAATEHARAAHTYGKLINNVSAMGLARAIQATLAFWAGEPSRGARLAEVGLEGSAAGTIAVRLHAVSARCFALMGDATATKRALAAAEEARTGSDETYDSLGGEFVFSPARTAFCAGAAYLALGDGDAAARAAHSALDLYASTPADQRWYGGVYGAHADLAAARIYSDDLADAADHMEQLLLAPVDLRTSRLVQRARRVQTTVAGRRYRGSPTAARLTGQAEAFVADATAARALPSSTP